MPISHSSSNHSFETLSAPASYIEDGAKITQDEQDDDELAALESIGSPIKMRHNVSRRRVDTLDELEDFGSPIKASFATLVGRRSGKESVDEGDVISHDGFFDDDYSSGLVRRISESLESDIKAVQSERAEQDAPKKKCHRGKRGGRKHKRTSVQPMVSTLNGGIGHNSPSSSFCDVFNMQLKEGGVADSAATIRALSPLLAENTAMSIRATMDIHSTENASLAAATPHTTSVEQMPSITATPDIVREWILNWVGERGLFMSDHDSLQQLCSIKCTWNGKDIRKRRYEQMVQELYEWGISIGHARGLAEDIVMERELWRQRNIEAAIQDTFRPILGIIAIGASYYHFSVASMKIHAQVMLLTKKETDTAYDSTRFRASGNNITTYSIDENTLRSAVKLYFDYRQGIRLQALGITCYLFILTTGKLFFDLDVEQQAFFETLAIVIVQALLISGLLAYFEIKIFRDL